MVLIIDFGSQLTQVIARRVRESGRYCEILPWDAEPRRFLDAQPRAVILSGSGESTQGVGPQPYIADELLELDCPVLAVCYGMQALTMKLEGGSVSVARGSKEFGHAVVSVSPEGAASPLLAGLTTAEEQSLHVWMSHGDSVTAVPHGFQVFGSTENCPVAIMGNNARRLYGVQFHPEVNETVCGSKLLENFLGKICGCPCNWTAQQIISDLVDDIHNQVGKNAGPGSDVLLALSGGVDSSVVACLMHKAIGPRVHCVMIDNGLLRQDEAKQVQQAFHTFNSDLSVTVIDAADKFLDKLQGVSDPEKKRKIIGNLFVECFEEFVETNSSGLLSNVGWLAQGTIYPDVIESAKSGKSALIKTHHNVGGLPEKMKLKLIEPVRRLFKDEVRRLGVELGLPGDFVWRHPFPGPGFGVRILGTVSKADTVKLRHADFIYMEELRASGFYEKTSQAFAVLLPVKSTAVKGDARAFEQVIALRAVETIDFMTARGAELPYFLLKKVSRRICNEVDGVSRVVYDLSDKPPGTIEWE